MRLVNMHIDDSRYANPFKGTNLCACVDSIGKPLHVKYDGGRCLLIETDCETVCAKFAGPEECGCDFPLAGFMSVMLADIDSTLVWYHNVQVLVALCRAGLFVPGQGFVPDVVPKGTEMPLPSERVAWEELGTKYKFNLYDKTLSNVCRNLVFVNAHGEFLYCPDAEFQEGDFIRAEDALMVTLLRESVNGIAYMRGCRYSDLIANHVERNKERAMAHRRLGVWMTGDVHYGEYIHVDR